MASRRTSIQVPPLQEGEQPATPEQLQFIRQLVTGMSLQGFRFDYRKLGTAQAGSVIDQLMQIQNMQQQSTNNNSSPGCVASFVRGVTTLVVSLIVIAGVAGGGYLIYQHIQSQPKQTADNTDTPDNSSDADNASPGSGNNNGTYKPTTKPPRKLEDSFIFGGLDATDDPDAPENPNINNPGSTGSTGTSNTQPQDPAAINQRLARQQAEQLEKMLVELSQFTRNQFDQSTRTMSVTAMQRHLAAMPEAMARIEADNAILATRIRAVVQEFGLSAPDGEAMRDEIKSIREALNTMFKAE